MRLAQVGKYMPEGLRALSNLVTMLSEAAAACQVSVKKGVALDYLGLTLDGGKYWIGVNFSEPEKLSFGTRCQVNPTKAAELGVGEVAIQSGRHTWWRKEDLDSESNHFFSRSKVSQMEWLEGFLRECLQQARSIQTPEQPTIPEEPEET